MVKFSKITTIFSVNFVKQRENYSEIQTTIEPRLLEKFEILGYIIHAKNEWQITPAGIEELQFYCENLTPQERELVDFYENYD